MLFPDNLGTKLSIDEVALTNGELYTILTHKAAHGKKNALVAMCEGTKASEIAPVLAQMPLEKRMAVHEVTLDMSEAMEPLLQELSPRLP